MSDTTETIQAATDEATTPAQAATGDDASRNDDQEALDALASLPPRQFARLCRRVPLRTFMAELEKLDRGVFFRHFKGYRQSKIDAAHLERVLHKEMFEKRNGLLAQLVIYNWDEAEYRLYGDLQKEVKKINEDVEAIEHIADEMGDAIVAALVATYDLRDIHIAFVINGVRVTAEYVAAKFASVMK